MALIAELLAVQADGHYPALAISPQQKREMTLTAIALRRYQLRFGHYPAALHELSPDWLAPLPCDYVDGKPLPDRKSNARI